MSTLQAFDLEVKQVVNKGKLSPTIVQAVVDLALANITSDAHLLSTLFRAHKKALPPNKLTSLYLVDAISREARTRAKKARKEKQQQRSAVEEEDAVPQEGKESKGTPATFLVKIEGFLAKMVLDCWENGLPEHREKVRKVLDIWTKAATFNPAVLARISNKLLASATSATPASTAASVLPNGQAPTTPAPSANTPAGVPASVLALLASSSQPPASSLQSRSGIEQAVADARSGITKRSRAPLPQPTRPPPPSSSALSPTLVLSPSDHALLRSVAGASNAPPPPSHLSPPSRVPPPEPSHPPYPQPLRPPPQDPYAYGPAPPPTNGGGHFSGYYEQSGPGPRDFPPPPPQPPRPYYEDDRRNPGLSNGNGGGWGGPPAPWANGAPPMGIGRQEERSGGPPPPPQQNHQRGGGLDGWGGGGGGGALPQGRWEGPPPPPPQGMGRGPPMGGPGPGSMMGPRPPMWSSEGPPMMVPPNMPFGARGNYSGGPWQGNQEMDPRGGHGGFAPTTGWDVRGGMAGARGPPMGGGRGGYSNGSSGPVPYQRPTSLGGGVGGGGALEQPRDRKRRCDEPSTSTGPDSNTPRRPPPPPPPPAPGRAKITPAPGLDEFGRVLRPEPTEEAKEEKPSDPRPPPPPPPPTQDPRRPSPTSPPTEYLRCPSPPTPSASPLLQPRPPVPTNSYVAPSPSSLPHAQTSAAPPLPTGHAQPFDLSTFNPSDPSAWTTFAAWCSRTWGHVPGNNEMAAIIMGSVTMGVKAISPQGPPIRGGGPPGMSGMQPPPGAFGVVSQGGAARGGGTQDQSRGWGAGEEQ